MFLSDFDYELPDELIARYPPDNRRDSRLLVVGESLSDRQFTDFPSLLNAGDLLVFNDTRVIRARLFGRKQTGGRVEILVERVLSDTSLRETMVAKGLARAKEFSWKTTAEKTVGVYERAYAGY